MLQDDRFITRTILIIIIRTILTTIIHTIIILFTITITTTTTTRITRITCTTWFTEAFKKMAVLLSGEPLLIYLRINYW